MGYRAHKETAMRIADAQWIPSTPHQTWDALMDPAVLQKCLPGCVKVERRTPTEYALSLHASVGGVEAGYEGEVLLSELNPPHSCTLARSEARRVGKGCVSAFRSRWASYE